MAYVYDAATVVNEMVRASGNVSLLCKSFMKMGDIDGRTVQDMFGLAAVATRDTSYGCAAVCATYKMNYLDAQEVRQPEEAEFLYITVEIMHFLNVIPAATHADAEKINPNAAGYSMNLITAGLPPRHHNGNNRNMEDTIDAIRGQNPTGPIALHAIVLLVILSKAGNLSRAHYKKVSKMTSDAFGDTFPVKSKDMIIFFNALTVHLSTLTEADVQQDLHVLLDIAAASSPRFRDQVLRMAGIGGTPIQIVRDAYNKSRETFAWAEIFALNHDTANKLQEQFALFENTHNDLVANNMMYLRGVAGIGKRIPQLLYLCKNLLILVFGEASYTDYKGGDEPGEHKAQLDRFITDYIALRNVGLQGLPALAQAGAPVTYDPNNQANPTFDPFATLFTEDGGNVHRHVVN